MRSIPAAIQTLLKGKRFIGANRPVCRVVFTQKPDGTAINLTARVRWIRISRDGSALAQRVTFTWPNVNPADKRDLGYYSPDRGDDDPLLANAWKGVLVSGTRFYVEMGYGSEYIRVFTGELDDNSMSRATSSAVVELDARDLGWNLVDRTITNDAGQFTITYPAGTLIENMVSDLLQRAGWAPGDITVESTNYALKVDVTWEETTYAEAIEWAMETTGFELVVDEYGAASFHYPTDRQPRTGYQALTLNGTTGVLIGKAPLVRNSAIVKDAPDGATVYQLDVDYTVNWSTGEFARVSGGAIADGATVYADAVYAAWVFREGEDLVGINPYRISRRNVYGTIQVKGAQIEGSDPPEHYRGTWTFAGGQANYGIPSDKLLSVEIPELQTNAECAQAAAQMGNDMAPHVREVNFVAVGVPWLQVGDCVQIIESSTTISEIYRLVSFDLEMVAGERQTAIWLNGAARYYGYAPHS